MADQNDIEVRFGADTSELDGASKEAAKSVQSVSETMKTATASVTSYSNSLTAAQRYTQQATDGHKQMSRAAQDSAQAAQDLASKYGTVGTQAAEFGKGLRSLNDQLKAGTITQAEHAAQLVALRSSVFGAGQAVDEVAKNVLNFGMSTSHAINGVRALTDELSSGRIHQAQGTFTRLFLEVAAANPTMAALGATVLVLGGGFAVAAVHAEELERAVNRVQDAFYATGRAGDYTDAQIESFIKQLQRLPDVSREMSEQTVTEIARIPDLSRPAFEAVLAHAADLAAALGIKLPQAAKLLAEAFADPEKGADKLDKQLNFLTATQKIAIETAVEHGDKMKAVQVVMDALLPRITGLTQEGTKLQKAENEAKNAWMDLSDALGHSEHIQSLLGEITHLTEAFAGLLRAMQAVSNWKPHIGFGGSGGNAPAAPPSKGGGGYSGSNLLTRQVNLGNSAPADADKQREAEELQKQALTLVEKYDGKVSQIRKTQAEINKLIAARNTTHDPALIAKYDEGIAGARERLANLQKPKKVSHAGQATQMDQWRAQFEQMKAQSLEQNGQEDYQAEIKFWQDRLSQAKAGSKTYIEVENEISRARIAAARAGNREAVKSDQEAYKARIQSLKTQQSEAAGDLPKQIAIEQQILDAAKARYGMQSAEYQKFLGDMHKLENQYKLQLANEDKAELTRALQSYESQLQVEAAEMQKKLKLHQITQEQMTQFEIEQAQKRLQAQETVLGIEEQKFKDFHKQYQQVLTQIEQAESQHNVKMAQLQAQLVEQQRAMWTAAGNAAQNSFTSSLQGILRGTTTFQNLMSNVALAVADSFIKSGVDMAAHWIEQQLLIKTATASTNASSGAASIATQAAVASAGAYASTAAIPVVGPELAPGAAQLAYSSVMGMQGLLVASAAGGWEVPRDQLMQVHEKEVVLPRAWAERFKQVTDNQAASNAGDGTQGQLSGGGGSPHIHIHTNDSKSFERQLSDSDSHLHTMFKKFLRNNHIK